MLDLTVINNEHYDIRLLDGTELKLKRPTQAMVEYTMKIEGMSKSENKAQVINALAELFVRILNRNTDGIAFNIKDITEEYDFQTIGYVIQDYFSYWNKEEEGKVFFQ